MNKGVSKEVRIKQFSQTLYVENKKEKRLVRAQEAGLASS